VRTPVTASVVFSSRFSGWFDLPLNKGEQYDFAFNDPYPALVTLRGRPEGKENGEWSCYYTVEARRPLDADGNRVLSVLASGRLPAGSLDHRNGLLKEDGSTQFFPGIADDGSFDPTKPAELQLLPANVAEIFYGESRADTIHALRVARIIGWRFGRERGSLRSESESAMWSVDGATWRPWPNSFYIESSGGSALRLSPQSQEWVQGRASSGIDEPAAHELLREAHDIRYESARGALILAAAAFETGVKACVIGLVPDAEWLVRQRSAPPAIQLLGTYLPKVVTSLPTGPIYPIPKKLYTALDDGMNLRNAVVHSNVGAVDAELVQRFVRLVRDFLYLFDFYLGHSWALRRIRPSTRQLLGIPEPPL
jgi:hypothetical protein